MKNQIHIIPDRKQRPDPDEVAAKFNKWVEEELRREALEKKLGKTENLEEKVKKIELPASLEEICKGYEEFMALPLGERWGKIPTEITDKYRPTAEQIKQFSEILIKYKNLGHFWRDTANYLTALMLSSPDNEFVIDLTKLNKKRIRLYGLGYKLKDKKLTIDGDVGDNVAYKAENCEIIVNGNVGNYVGYDAKNCQITINGNAGDWVGELAKICQITINGNAGNGVGRGAETCQITINGNAGIYVGYGAKNCQITINGNAGGDVGFLAKYCTTIKIKGKIKGLSSSIGIDTEVYQWKNNKWEKIYPK